MKKGANNMPVHAPLFPDPFVPYESPDYTSLYAVVEVEEAEVRRILSYTPFEYVSNLAVISVSDFSNCNKISYMDSAIVVPVMFEGKAGGYYVYEYENNDAAIAAGRELWGYPKKYGEITLREEGGEIHGAVKKDGETFLELSGKLKKSKALEEEPVTTPHFTIRPIANPRGGSSSVEIIERDTSPDFRLKSKQNIDVRLSLKSTKKDPLELLKASKVISGGVIKGDFFATEENGWGDIIAEY